MKPKQIVKISVDAAMTLGMLVLMGYHLSPTLNAHGSPRKPIGWDFL